MAARRCRPAPRTARRAPLTQPRPGHADLAGMQKYGFDRRARRPGAGLGPRDRGAGRRRAPWPSAAGPARRRRSCSHVVQHRVGRRAEAAAGPARPTSTRVDELRGPLLRRRGRGGDDRRDQGRGQGGRLASAASSRCSPTACRSGSGSHVHWDRKLDALLGPGAHEHPGGEGRGDRRRVRGRRAAGERGPRPDPWDADAGAYRRESHAGRRHRGRHVHRRGRSWRGRHEAAGHAQPARRCAPSTPRPRRRRSRSRSAPTSPRCPPWAWWPRRWSALVLADEATRKFGGDSVAELCRNARRRSATSLRDELDGRSPTHVVLVGLMGAGKTTVGARWPRGSTGRSSTPTTVVEARAGRTVARDLRARRRSRRSGRSRPRRSPSCSTDREPAVIAAGGGVGARRRRTARALRGADVVVVWLRRRPAFLRRPGRRQRRAPPAARRAIRPEVLDRLHGERDAALRRGRRRDRRRRRRHRARADGRRARGARRRSASA